MYLILLDRTAMIQKLILIYQTRLLVPASNYRVLSSICKHILVGMHPKILQAKAYKLFLLTPHSEMHC